MTPEFSFAVTMVTGNRKEMELLPSSAGQTELLTGTRISDYSMWKILHVCFCVWYTEIPHNYQAAAK